MSVNFEGSGDLSLGKKGAETREAQPMEVDEIRGRAERFVNPTVASRIPKQIYQELFLLPRLGVTEPQYAADVIKITSYTDEEGRACGKSSLELSGYRDQYDVPWKRTVTLKEFPGTGRVFELDMNMHFYGPDRTTKLELDEGGLVLDVEGPDGVFAAFSPDSYPIEMVPNSKAFWRLAEHYIKLARESGNATGVGMTARLRFPQERGAYVGTDLHLELLYCRPSEVGPDGKPRQYKTTLITYDKGRGRDRKGVTRSGTTVEAFGPRKPHSLSVVRSSYYTPSPFED